MMRIKLFLGTAFLMVALLVASAAPAFATGSSGGDDGNDCNSTNANSQLVNLNLIGNQTQGSCNDSNTNVSVDAEVL